MMQASYSGNKRGGGNGGGDGGGVNELRREVVELKERNHRANE